MVELDYTCNAIRTKSQLTLVSVKKNPTTTKNQEDCSDLRNNSQQSRILGKAMFTSVCWLRGKNPSTLSFPFRERNCPFFD